MKAPLPISSPLRQRGSALITVLLFSFMLLTLVGSVMQWSVTERRLNSRGGSWLEARNAAEAVAEYGCYQVAQAFNGRMNPTFVTGGTNPISFPSSVTSSFFAASSTSLAGSKVTSSSIALNAGTVTQVPSTGLYYVDPADPNNRYDPMVGRYCYRRDVTVLSKATVAPPAGATGSSISAYIMQKVSVRGAPLFAYAIFYSGNDLEINPLPQMDIWGPVHVNGNLFVGQVGTSNLNFRGPVSASGNLYRSWRGTTSTAQQGGTTIATSYNINFATDSTGNNMGPLKATSGTYSGTWTDSTMGADASSGGTVNTTGLNNLIALVTSTRTTQFAQTASQRFGGNLQTAAHGIQPYNPMGFSEIVGTSGGNNILATDDAADDGSNVGTGAGYGHGYGPHALIEPSMALAASTDTYKAAKDAIEEQKFANKAGLYVKVDVDASSNLVSAVTIYGDPRSAPSGTPAADIGPNGGIKLGTVPANVLQYIKYQTAVVGGTTRVTSGMYDKHQSKGINVVQLDMGALRTALTDMTGATTTANTTIYAADNVTKWGSSGVSGGYDKYNANSTGYNGGIYVAVTSASTTTHTAVFLSNGAVTTGNSLVPSVNSVSGLTVATNAPVYVLGNFNANGTVTTGATNSALYPDDYPGTAITASRQVPVAIAADAITILSNDYFGTAGSSKIVPTTQASGSAYNSFATASPAATSDSEVAAAFISGSNTTPATSSGTQEYSGGVHNMPRFLENWSGRTVAIRGSLVSMYNTRIATGAWSSSYYSPPNRQWGFDQVFANGTYPPICPTVLTYRRSDFTYLTAAQYTAALSAL